MADVLKSIEENGAIRSSFELFKRLFDNQLRADMVGEQNERLCALAT